MIDVRKTVLKSDFWVAIDDIRAKGGICHGRPRLHGHVTGWFILVKLYRLAPGMFLQQIY